MRRSIRISFTLFPLLKRANRDHQEVGELLLRLAEELNARERYEELYYWTSVWVGLDDRDITARAYYLQALRHNSERYREALDGLAPQGALEEEVNAARV